MESTTNDLGQPIGRALPAWRGASVPSFEPIRGERCWLEALDADLHAEPLHAAYAVNEDGSNWTYLPYGPFSTTMAYREWVEMVTSSDENYFFAVIDATSKKPVGVAAYLRVSPEIGSIEVGHLSYAPILQRTPASTEAMYLMMRRVFEDWGYRRYEWKCDRLNGPSAAAARRLGFRFEGVFRHAQVMKGRNRDTAWFSITDAEWPDLRRAFEAWLAPENFDGAGTQRKRLEALMPEFAGGPLFVPAPSD